MPGQKYRITIEFEAISRADHRDITAVVSEVVKDAARLCGSGLLDARVVSVMLDGRRSDAKPSPSDPDEVRVHRQH